MVIKVFIDSDVFISSVISQTGAANLLINKTNVKLFVSNISIDEIRKVSLRLRLKNSPVKNLLEKRFSKIIIQESLPRIKLKYKKYVKDADDAHIVAGAEKGNVRFLISYNIRDFYVEKIKNDFGVLVMPPALFLQYLRSLDG